MRSELSTSDIGARIGQIETVEHQLVADWCSLEVKFHLLCPVCALHDKQTAIYWASWTRL